MKAYMKTYVKRGSRAACGHPDGRGCLLCQVHGLKDQRRAACGLRHRHLHLENASRRAKSEPPTCWQAMIKTSRRLESRAPEPERSF